MPPPAAPVLRPENRHKPSIVKGFFDPTPLEEQPSPRWHISCSTQLDERPASKPSPTPGGIMDDFSNETAAWLEDCIGVAVGDETELEIGVLIAAASEWTEDEMELDDLVVGLIESGRVQLQMGSDARID